MATVLELHSLIGQRADWKTGGVSVEVRIVDLKPGVWGSTLVEIEPVAGSGRVWVRLDRISVHTL